MSGLLERLDPVAERAMRELIGGSLRTQAIYVVAKLGVADQLAFGARRAEEIASAIGAQAAPLRRVMRYLVTCGVFAESADGALTLTRLGEYLQTAHPRSMRPSAIRAGEGLWQTTSRLYDAVMTGATPHDVAHGASFFERVADSGKEPAFASRMRGSVAGLEAIADLSAVPEAGTIVDVGGGHGALLVAILRRHSHLRGILFDRAATIDAVRESIAASDVAARCELVAGDFFEAVPRGDVYLLSWILHDWDDARARAILRACRNANANATLLIVEVLLPEVASVADATSETLADPFTLDLQMLLLTGGKERTRNEYAALLEEEGFAVRSVTPLRSTRGASVIVAGAVGAER